MASTIMLQENSGTNFLKKSKAGRKPKPEYKIAIDAGSISDSDERSQAGVHTITRLLIEELLRLDKRNQYIILSFHHLNLASIELLKRNVRVVVLPRIGFKTIWMRLAFWWYKPHVFLATSQAAPDHSPHTLGFIYDAAFLDFPKLYKNAKKLKQNTEKLVQSAKHIVMISKSSAKRLQNEYTIPDSGISILYPGVDSIFRSDGPKYVSNKPYFLYVGAIKPTKNLINLIKAFAIFLEKSPRSYELVIVGSTKGIDAKIPSLIKELHLMDKVILSGFVDTQQLPKFYRGAQAFTSIAFAEGFGLPVLEAMSCGIPVIVANNSSMPELVGKGGLYVDETNIEKIADAMLQLTNNITRKVLANNALKKSREFSSKEFARRILETVYTYCV